MAHAPKLLSVSMPEYDLSRTLDYERLGSMLDRLLLANFPDGDYVERSIGSQDHPGKSVAQLVDLIREHGTDLYDGSRRSIFTEDFSDYSYDIHATPFSIRDGQIEFEPDGFASYFAETLYDFHHNAKLDRGYSVRVDIIMIYAAAALLPAVQVANTKPSAARYAKYLYRFDLAQPGKGLVGLIVIE